MPSRTPLESYVRDIADRIGLRDWTLQVDLGDAGGPDRRDGQAWGACASPVAGRKHGTITLAEAALSQPQNDLRETIVHELVHFHFAALVDQLRNDLDDYLPPSAFDLFNNGITRNLEYGVDACAEAIAPHMPMPPKTIKGAAS